MRQQYWYGIKVLVPIPDSFIGASQTVIVPNKRTEQKNTVVLHARLAHGLWLSWLSNGTVVTAPSDNKSKQSSVFERDGERGRFRNVHGSRIKQPFSLAATWLKSLGQEHKSDNIFRLHVDVHIFVRMCSLVAFEVVGYIFFLVLIFVQLMKNVRSSPPSGPS